MVKAFGLRLCRVKETERVLGGRVHSVIHSHTIISSKSLTKSLGIRLIRCKPVGDTLLEDEVKFVVCECDRVLLCCRIKGDRLDIA